MYLGVHPNSSLQFLFASFYFPGWPCSQTTLFGGSWVTKKMAKKTRKCSLRRATNVTLSKFRGWRRKLFLMGTLITLQRADRNEYVPRNFVVDTVLLYIYIYMYICIYVYMYIYIYISSPRWILSAKTHSLELVWPSSLLKVKKHCHGCWISKL